MPESTITVLICDAGGCGRQDGVAYLVERDGIRRRIILCPDHNDTLEWALKVGTNTARQKVQGLDRERLLSLHRPNP